MKSASRQRWRESMRENWRAAHGFLGPGARVAVVGAGISGLHLAFFLRKRGFDVTVFDEAGKGSMRIPIMHACHTKKKPATLRHVCAEFARSWYGKLPAGITFTSQNEFGIFFRVAARRYQVYRRAELKSIGAKFIQTTVAMNSLPLADYDLSCIATGAQAQGVAGSALRPGWESYFSRFGAHPSEFPDFGQSHGSYITFPGRAAFIHANRESRDTALEKARILHPKGRHALFHGVRLTTRDRLPIVGFRDGIQPSPFLFCGMGYHGMTYSPFLAHAAAAQLAGDTPIEENLVCTLSPARFLPRS